MLCYWREAWRMQGGRGLKFKGWKGWAECRWGSQIFILCPVLFSCLIPGRIFGFKNSCAQIEFGVRLRNPERVELPLSNVSWWAWGDGLAEVHRLPLSNNPWYA